MTLIRWVKRNWFSFICIVLLIGLTVFHFFGTHNPPITQTVMVSPITENKKLDNGDLAQVKVNTPSTDNPYESGFSEEYIRDTIGKIIGIKEKEILAINKVTGKYSDSLQLYKTELDEQKRLTKFYQSKDRNGNVIGSASSTENGSLVYKGNISLATIVKKGKQDKRGKIITPDSLIFFDPTQRITINNSLEYSHPIPVKTKKQRITISTHVGAGIVAPKFDSKNLTYGYYLGAGLSYNF